AQRRGVAGACRLIRAKRLRARLVERQALARQVQRVPVARWLHGGEHDRELLEAAEELREPALEAVLAAAAAVRELLDELRQRPAREREAGVVAAPAGEVQARALDGERGGRLRIGRLEARIVEIERVQGEQRPQPRLLAARDDRRRVRQAQVHQRTRPADAPDLLERLRDVGAMRERAAGEDLVDGTVAERQ